MNNSISTRSARQTGFRRLETDRELRARAIAIIGWTPWQLATTGEQLDDAAWSFARIQRRIVEDVK